MSKPRQQLTETTHLRLLLRLQLLHLLGQRLNFLRHFNNLRNALPAAAAAADAQSLSTVHSGVKLSGLHGERCDVFAYPRRGL